VVYGVKGLLTVYTASIHVGLINLSKGTESQGYSVECSVGQSYTVECWRHRRKHTENSSWSTAIEILSSKQRHHRKV